MWRKVCDACYACPKPFPPLYLPWPEGNILGSPPFQISGPFLSEPLGQKRKISFKVKPTGHPNPSPTQPPRSAKALHLGAMKKMGPLSEACIATSRSGNGSQAHALGKQKEEHTGSFT